MTEDIKKILELAVWAPSGDNSQPWKFKVENNTLEVYYTPNVDHPILNYNDSGSFVAHGALIENINLISKDRGLKTHIEIFPNPSNKNITAKITFEKSNEGKDGLVDYIKTRHTNRKPYKDEGLSQAEKDTLYETNKEFTNAQLKLIEDIKKRKLLGRIGSIMEEIALKTEELHRLFFKSILWNRADSVNGKKGLYIKTLELPLPIQKLFKAIKHWSFMRFMNLLGFYKIAALSNAQIYSSGSAIGIISIPNTTSKNFIEAGRAMQRVWLKATKLGLSLQPVTGLMFLAQRIEAGDKSVFSDNQVEQIKQSINKVREEFGLSKNEFPAMMFRIGRGKPVTDRSGRRGPEYI